MDSFSPPKLLRKSIPIPGTVQCPANPWITNPLCPAGAPNPDLAWGTHSASSFILVPLSAPETQGISPASLPLPMAHLPPPENGNPNHQFYRKSPPDRQTPKITASLNIIPIPGAGDASAHILIPYQLCSSIQKPDKNEKSKVTQTITQKSGLIPKRPQSSECSGQQKLLFLCLSLHYLCLLGAPLLPAIHNAICSFSMAASSSPGASTGHAHSLQCMCWERS